MRLLLEITAPLRRGAYSHAGASIGLRPSSAASDLGTFSCSESGGTLADALAIVAKLMLALKGKRKEQKALADVYASLKSLNLNGGE